MVLLRIARARDSIQLKAKLFKVSMKARNALTTSNIKISKAFLFLQIFLSLEYSYKWIWCPLKFDRFFWAFLGYVFLYSRNTYELR